MAEYRIRVTWVEHGTQNAAMLGMDESEDLVEAATAQQACQEFAEEMVYHGDDAWQTGRYDVVAEHLDGPEIVRLEPDEETEKRLVAEG